MEAKTLTFPPMHIYVVLAVVLMTTQPHRVESLTFANFAVTSSGHSDNPISIKYNLAL